MSALKMINYSKSQMHSSLARATRHTDTFFFEFLAVSFSQKNIKLIIILYAYSKNQHI